MKECSIGTAVRSYHSYMIKEVRNRLVSLSMEIVRNNRAKWTAKAEGIDFPEDLLVSTPALDMAMVDLSVNLEMYLAEVLHKFHFGGSDTKGRAVLNVSPDVATLLSRVLPEYKYTKKVSDEKTLWETQCGLLPESSITAYTRYINVVYKRVKTRVQDYFLDNKVKCVDGKFLVYDSPYDWSYFINYVTQYMVEIFIRFNAGSKDDNYIELTLNSVYEKYALRYFLSTFKSDLGLRVLYNNSTSSLVLPRDCESDISFSDKFEENYTSKTLNLSGENFIGNLVELESCDLESYLLIVDKPNSDNYIEELLAKHPRYRKYYDSELV